MAAHPRRQELGGSEITWVWRKILRMGFGFGFVAGNATLVNDMKIAMFYKYNDRALLDG